MLKKFGRFLVETAKDLLETVFPFSCRVCGSGTSFGLSLCRGCSRRLEADIHAFEPVALKGINFPVSALGRFSEVLAATIKVVKYRRARKLLESMAPAVRSAAESLPRNQRPEILVPVPLHPSRERERGFNQSAVFGGFLAETWGIPLTPLLERVRKTIPQAECNEETRRSNLSGAFRIRSGAIADAFRCRHVGIVDDVVTTGSTLEECAKTVASFSNGNVSGWVLAFAPRFFPQKYSVEG